MEKDEIVAKLFMECVSAIKNGVLIHRSSAADKEFHFQNWIKDRLTAIKVSFSAPGRNSFPDFAIDDRAVGFEVKGLAYPGREKNYDGNSQSPKSQHKRRTIYYVFGRYPKEPGGNNYRVVDLVICPGSFLNTDADYVHKNKKAEGFGSYGDIMIRDRKMYVIPTPYSLVDGLALGCTLITPYETTLSKPFICVGELARVESKKLLASYHFDLFSNELTTTTKANPNAGKEHKFKGWQLEDQRGEGIRMRSMKDVIKELELFSDEDE
jgi:hypothetical protein